MSLEGYEGKFEGGGLGLLSWKVGRHILQISAFGLHSEKGKNRLSVAPEAKPKSNGLYAEHEEKFDVVPDYLGISLASSF